MVHTAKKQRRLDLSVRAAPLRRFAADDFHASDEDGKPTSRRDEIAQDILERLWSALPIARLCDEVGHRGIKHVIQTASASHSQIVQWHSELRQFIDDLLSVVTVIENNQIVEPSAFRPWLFDAAKNECGLKSVSPLPPRSFVDAHFADLLPEIALERAKQELERHCSQIVTTLFNVLDALQRHRRIGSVTFGDAACQFTFFTREVRISDRQDSRVTKRRLDPAHTNRWVKAYFEDDVRQTRLTVQHRDIARTHYVFDFTLNCLNKTRFPVPGRYQAFCEAVPDWIRPSLRILEGDLFREQCVASDAREDQFLEEVVVSTSWTRCPAIMLGPYVLAGWGNEAIESEEESHRVMYAVADRNRSIHRAALTSLASKCIAVSAIVCALMSAVLGATAAVIAIVLTTLAMHLAGMSARDRHGFTDTSLVLHEMARVGTSTFAAQAFIFGLLTMSWPLSLVGGVLALIAHRLSQQSKETTA
ncbi:MAG: hypothetical protein KDA92_02415 [Planctomycetales bacterium]|nr:hypothetical protein [Planctomycetales bacterium]